MMFPVFASFVVDRVTCLAQLLQVIPSGALRSRGTPLSKVQLCSRINKRATGSLDFAELRSG